MRDIIYPLYHILLPVEEIYTSYRMCFHTSITVFNS